MLIWFFHSTFHLLFFFQSFPGPSLESEDFNIPPITPPSLPDHSLVHLNEIESGYHSLCHPMNHNGLLPFHPQNMDLPEITVSNMLGQDGTLLSNSLSVVSTFSLSLLFCFKCKIMEIQTCLKSFKGANTCTTQILECTGLTLGVTLHSPCQIFPPAEVGGDFQMSSSKPGCYLPLPWVEVFLLYRDVNNARKRLWLLLEQGLDPDGRCSVFVWWGSFHSHLHVLRDVQKFNISFLVYRTFGKQQMLFLILGQILQPFYSS